MMLIGRRLKTVINRISIFVWGFCLCEAAKLVSEMKLDKIWGLYMKKMYNYNDTFLATWSENDSSRAASCSSKEGG